jgi:hypothetical protein
VHAAERMDVQVWTYKGRVAFVLSVTENGRPIEDHVRLDRLIEFLTSMVEGGGGIVHVETVSGF